MFQKWSIFRCHLRRVTSISLSKQLETETIKVGDTNFPGLDTLNFIRIITQIVTVNWFLI